MGKYLFFLLALRTLGRLPLAILYPLAVLVSRLAYYLAPKARRNVFANLRHVMPDAPEKEVRQAAKSIFENVVLYYADLARMPYMDIHGFLHERLEFYGLEEHVLPALERGNGVILLSGHLGNPELAVQGLLPLGIHAVALTEPQKPAALSRLMDNLRRSHGHDFGPVSMGMVKLAIQTLKKGGLVTLMGDRDIEGPRAVFPFFGTHTLMPTGPIEMALRTGATVIPSFSRRRNRRLLEAFMEEPLSLERTGDREEDVRRGTMEFLERLERRLREWPGQWMVLESVWDHVAETPAEAVSVAGDG